MTNEISQKQLEANRQNAKLGGVKTEEGKTVSKYNALKHGLLSAEVLLEGEDEQTLVELGRKIRGELKPVGEIEILLADRIIANMWRLRRVMEVERNLMEWRKEEKLTDPFNDKKQKKQTKRRAVADMVFNVESPTFLRYEAAIERSIYKALHELQRTQATRAGEKPPVPIAIDVDVSGVKE